MPIDAPPTAPTGPAPFHGNDDPTVVIESPARPAPGPTPGHWATPSGGMPSPPPPPAPPGGPSDRRPWRHLPVVAAAVLSAVLTSGATAALVDDSSSEPVASSSEAGDAGQVAPIEVVDGSEQIAAAAAAVSPAVVQIETRTGVGSGVVYDEDGLVLTVAHVVGESSTVDVRLADGSTVTGEVVGTHTETDVAVVRVDPADVIAVAELATGTEPVVGQVAVAVGSPFGLDQTVTSGIVSAVDRVVNDVAMVQTDAAINPGNSGGPLVDGEGRVIGLSDVIFSESGGNEGVGFAVQIDVAKLVADQLVEGRQVQLALLGVSTTDSADGLRGAQVAEVVPGSAAADAGLQVGDLLVSIDGDPVADGGQLRAQIIRRSPGTEVTLTVVRDGDEQDLDVTLGATGE